MGTLQIISILLFIFCSCANNSENQKVGISSPDGIIELLLNSSPDKLTYSVKYNCKELIFKSALGFIFKNMIPLDENY